MKTNNWFIRLLDCIFPPRCVFCGKAISSGEQICSECASNNKKMNSVRCIELPDYEKTIQCAIPFLYDGNVRNSIIQFKFYGKKQYAAYYASVMAEQIANNFLALHIDVVTSVPISEARMKVRKYNQSELIAKDIAKQLNLSYKSLLIKTKNNKEQHKLHVKERRQNVKGVYQAVNAKEIEGRTVLLIDDIITTGATVSECCRVLFLANAKSVICAAAAQVPC